MTPIVLQQPTVRDVIAALQQCDLNARVVLNNRDSAFMVSMDAAIPPDAAGQHFEMFAFIDPMRIVPEGLHP